MTLTDRMAGTPCAVVGCERRRAPDSLVCHEDLNELWKNRLVKQADGTYLRRRLFLVRDFTRSNVA